MKRVSAEAMGLPEFDEAAFAAKVEEIQVRRTACWSLFSMTGIP